MWFGLSSTLSASKSLSRSIILTPDKAVINQTQKWLSTVVIAHILCPFAKREYDRCSIHYAVIRAADLQTQLEHVIQHCIVLDNDESIETSLLIFPDALHDFEAYLNLLDIATALLNEDGYEGEYQLASFHPEYRFADTPDDDPSHYTNRSPYPMLHILREASVEQAINNHPNPEKIPERNIQVTRDLGLEVMRGLLAECYE